MNGPWSQSWMREICTSGLMSGIWKRNGMTVTAPDLDSTAKGEATSSLRVRKLLNRRCASYLLTAEGAM